VNVSAGVASSPAMLSISPNKMREINDPILELLAQLHRIILITQVSSSHISVTPAAAAAAALRVLSLVVSTQATRSALLAVSLQQHSTRTHHHHHHHHCLCVCVCVCVCVCPVGAVTTLQPTTSCRRMLQTSAVWSPQFSYQSQERASQGTGSTLCEVITSRDGVLTSSVLN